MNSAPFTAPSAGDAHRDWQYRRGLKMAEDGAEIHINLRGSWTARYPNTRYQPGSFTATYVEGFEILGYHADTDALYAGWIDGGATIVDHRVEEGNDLDRS